jgi:hypothetical protein
MEPSTIDARIDELQRILSTLEAEDDSRLAIHERLEQLHQAAYEEYRVRWLNVPGDHGPGRLLDYTTWRKLAEELAQLRSQATQDGSDLDPRYRQLCRLLFQPVKVVYD